MFLSSSPCSSYIRVLRFSTFFSPASYFTKRLIHPNELNLIVSCLKDASIITPGNLNKNVVFHGNHENICVSLHYELFLIYIIYINHSRVMLSCATFLSFVYANIMHWLTKKHELFSFSDLFVFFLYGLSDFYCGCIFLVSRNFLFQQSIIFTLRIEMRNFRCWE